MLATLNHISFVSFAVIGRNMGETPTLPPPSSIHAILRSIANLSDLDVKEVFQGMAIMPQISSALLNRMSGLLSDMYEDSRDVPTPLKRMSAR